MSLFQKSVEKKYLNELDFLLIDKKYREFQGYFGNPEIQRNIKNLKEEEFQEGFLRESFVNILGYTLNPQPDFNLVLEKQNVNDAKKADGAILKGKDVIAVIELKGTDTTDLDKIETQAFGYKNHNPKCVYVITSNFEKLRFYIQNAVDHIDFDLFNLTKEQFSLLWLCLSKDSLLAGLPLRIKELSVLQEENITRKLYTDYTKFREAIYTSLVKNNPGQDKLLLFRKTQKLLDRFLFILFAEDRLLVPANSINQIVEKWKDDVAFGDKKQLYDIFKQYFNVLNTGRPKSGSREEIFAYNGGLFAPDEILDHITIDDDILHQHTLTLSQYDYETDVDVNILGHIFENSLGEIETVQAEIKGEQIDAHKTKRKKDGIFYTPKYITKYIVENTIGKLCEKKRSELGIIDEDFAKGRKNRKNEIILSLDRKLNEYRNWLLSLSILDPACGSGAFLNQALDFLITEHRKIDELRAQLLGGGFVFSDITTDILEKNIYGVDINEESVEIAKLSLWLRTAQKGRKLNQLNNNIKCGNSLIDNPALAGDKAFNWQKEFPSVFQKKAKKAWHITTATHNSRYSQRMFDNHVVTGEAEWLDTEDEIIITETVKEIVTVDKLNVVEYNICGDHMHILLVCEESEVPKIVGKLKSVSAKIRNRRRGYTEPPIVAEAEAENYTGSSPGSLPDSSPGSSPGTSTRGHAPLSDSGFPSRSPSSSGFPPLSPSGSDSPSSSPPGSGFPSLSHPGRDFSSSSPPGSDFPSLSPFDNGSPSLSPPDSAPRDTLSSALRVSFSLSNAIRPDIPVAEKNRGETQRPVWTQKFGSALINDEEYLANAIEYIRNNRKKHGLPVVEKIEILKREFLCTCEHAFRTEYKGGFDVVIGNPPYVQLQSIGEMSDKLSKCGFEAFDKGADLYCLFTERGFKLLKPGGLQSYIMPNKWMLVEYGKPLRRFLSKTGLMQVLNFGDIQFFEEAATIVCIFVTRHGKPSEKVDVLSLNKISYRGDFLTEVKKNMYKYPSSKFGESEWSIQPYYDSMRLEKMKFNGIRLKDLPVAINYGIKTGYNEAFYIDENTREKLIIADPKSEELIRPMVRGRNIIPYGISGFEYLINTHNGIKEKNPPLLPTLIDDYPAIKKHLEPFYPMLQKRVDKGDTPYNLRNCAYLEEFTRPKIIYPNMTSVFPFTYDETGFFSNDKSFILTANNESVSLLYLTALFNSSLAKLWIWYNCPELQGGTREIRKIYFENFPVPRANEGQTNQLANLALQRTHFTSGLQNVVSRFTRTIQRKFNLTGLSQKLQNWNTLSYADLVKELAKSKIKLTLSDEAEWEEYFTSELEKAKKLQYDIVKTDQEIDRLVHELYGLSSG